jgi:protoheme IX farnesyltransferase
MAPVIAWVAVSGKIAMAPLILFAMIFLWTPPHFWSLALSLRSDYKAVGYPMMPVARGDKITKRLIVKYSCVLLFFSVGAVYAGAGILYAIIAVLLGLIFIYKSIQLLRSDSIQAARGFFRYSIVHLLSLLAALIVDSAVETMI